MKALISGFVAILALSASQAAINPVISSGAGGASPGVRASPSNFGLLSQEQVVQGLKEALNKGVQQAVTELGHDGGFLNNLQVRIPMPQQLQTVDKALRALGQGRVADEFIAAMNHAAEQAVPQAGAVFVDAIQHMTIGDARAIVTGPDDAATQYFRRATQTNLYERFLPIVKSATDSAGVTSAYKRLLGAAGQNKYLGALESLFMRNQSVDLDSYVTDRALDGLFKMAAQEEARIRKNPVARTTELLQRIFGGS